MKRSEYLANLRLQKIRNGEPVPPECDPPPVGITAAGLVEVLHTLPKGATVSISMDYAGDVLVVAMETEDARHARHFTPAEVETSRPDPVAEAIPKLAAELVQFLEIRKEARRGQE